MKGLGQGNLGSSPIPSLKIFRNLGGVGSLQDIKGWLVVYDRKTQELRKFPKYGGHSEDSFAVSYTETLVFINEGVVIK